jgi:UDP-3-O-[3-hydroxymyristoyl] glucosamine N-acyltransferase
METENPSLAFSRIISLLFPIKQTHPHGIHEKACVSKKAKLGDNVSVGANTTIEDDAEIGSNSIVYAMKSQEVCRIVVLGPPP